MHRSRVELAAVVVAGVAACVTVTRIKNPNRLRLGLLR